MPRLTEQLRQYGAYLDTLDVEPVRASPRPRRPRIAVLAAAVVVTLAAAGGAVTLLSNHDATTGRVQIPRTAPSTAPVTTLAPTTVPTTTAPATTAPVTEPPLTRDSRLGFAGLGSLKLGASFADAERLANITFVNNGCGWTVSAGSDAALNAALKGIEVQGDRATSQADVPASTVVQISVDVPEISTISGIHVGSTKDDVLRTYPGAEEQSGDVQIQSADGRTIQFFIGKDAVVGMRLFFTGHPINVNPLC
jgi:hypothetical protein